MYKIVRVVEISRKSIENLSFHINKYINGELQEDEFLSEIEYFKDNELSSTYPTLAYLHIAKIIKE